MTRRQRTICALAARAGISRPRVEHKGRGHPRLIGEIGGKPFRVVVPGTPSDWRSLKNLKSELRRMVLNEERA